MNERIRELAIKAGGFYASGFEEVGSEFCLVDADIEKFAILIVQECINLSKGRRRAWFKQHFGIKE